MFYYSTSPEYHMVLKPGNEGQVGPA